MNTDFETLLKSVLVLEGTFLLRNEFATGEFKDGPYTYKKSDVWLTLYPASEQNSERASHIHFRWQELKYAQIKRPEKRTPQLQFFDKDREKAPFVFTFPSFYDWSHEASPIIENQNKFHEWVKQWGEEFQLRSDDATS
ncbi:MAG: hypothetical protein ACO20H_12275 [Bacteriovoracaceae bacterium]